MRMMLLTRSMKCLITSFGTKTWRTWSRKRMSMVRMMTKRRLRR